MAADYKGYTRGVIEGRAEGEAKGRAEGEAKSRAEERLTIARSVLTNGIPMDTIIKSIDCSTNSQ